MKQFTDEHMQAVPQKKDKSCIGSCFISFPHFSFLSLSSLFCSLLFSFFLPADPKIFSGTNAPMVRYFFHLCWGVARMHSVQPGSQTSWVLACLNFKFNFKMADSKHCHLRLNLSCLYPGNSYYKIRRSCVMENQLRKCAPFLTKIWGAILVKIQGLIFYCQWINFIYRWNYKYSDICKIVYLTLE